MHLINYLMRLSCHSRWYQRFRSTIQHMCLDRILMHLERFIIRKIDHFSQATCSFFYMKIMQFFRLSIKINWIDIADLYRLCCTQALIHFQRIILIAMIHLVFVRNIYHSLLCSHHHFLFIFYLLLTLTHIILAFSFVRSFFIILHLSVHFSCLLVLIGLTCENIQQPNTSHITIQLYEEGKMKNL